jgi:hypothetical protein
MPRPLIALAAQRLLPAPRSDLADLRSSTAAHRIVPGHEGASMKKRSRAPAGAITAICLSLGLGSAAYTQTHSSVPNPVQKGTAMPTHASGTFEVKLLPQPPDDKAEGSTS